MTTTMQRRLYGHATDVGIRPLNEEKAVQAAVDLLGEFFVFSVLFIFPLDFCNNVCIVSYPDSYLLHVLIFVKVQTSVAKHRMIQILSM